MHMSVCLGDVTGRPLQEMDDRSDKRKYEVCRDVESVEVDKKKFCKGFQTFYKNCG